MEFLDMEKFTSILCLFVCSNFGWGLVQSKNETPLYYLAHLRASVPGYSTFLSVHITLECTLTWVSFAKKYPASFGQKHPPRLGQSSHGIKTRQIFKKGSGSNQLKSNIWFKYILISETKTAIWFRSWLFFRVWRFRSWSWWFFVISN